MSDSHLFQLLQELERKAIEKATLTQIDIPVYQEDMVRLEALAETYGLTAGEVASSLMRTILKEVEEKMPYRAGDKIIRLEDDEPVYEDIGPTPRYLAAKKRLEKSRHKSH